MPSVAPSFLPSRMRSLRIVAHTRHILLVILPLGAVIGLCVGIALKGLGSFEPMVLSVGGRTGFTLLLPAVGLFLTTLWLSVTRIGEVSLFKDLDLAKRDPYRVFPPLTSLGKVVACTLTIAFGGSAGVEGPGKWFGAALGLQYHRLLKFASTRISFFRHFVRPPMVLVRSGAAAALAAVFRAPLSGALMAAEHHNRIATEALAPCLVSGAAGYVVFSGIMGHAPLIPLASNYPYSLGIKDFGMSLLLGALCGGLAYLYHWLRNSFQIRLSRIHLPWRGLAAGIGLTLLALPGHFIFHDLQITQGGGLELIHQLLQGGTLPRDAALFVALKLLATALTFAGGGVGGLWLPSLAIGAALGAGFDALVGSGHAAYLAVVGASALTGATHETLLVPVVFLAETTGQAALVVPALIGTTVSFLIVREVS
nr:chloride channel protein [uncultured Holophaga sp.]